MLSKTLLQQLANAGSYSRGEDYFHNNYVRRIKRTGNTFTGKVEGSELYEVSLTLGRSGVPGGHPDFDCNCPYNFEGICKHCVAFGLAVIDQFGPVIELADTGSATEAPAVDLDQVWQQTTADQQLTFLRQLLDKQPDLRAQLAQFAGLRESIPRIVFFTPETPDPADNADSIDTISTGVFESLSDLRFDDDGLEMDEEDHYSEESPDPDPLIESVLTDYAEQVSKALREGRLTDALVVYLGVYEGTQSAIEPEDDEYGIIDDYQTQTWAVWNGLLADAYAQFASRVLHPDQIGQALGELAGRVRFFDEIADNPNELYYDVKAFEPLLLALVTDMPSARAVQHAIGQHDWTKRGTEYIQLRIADVLRDPDLWLQTADQFADHDPTIALQLLQRQQQTGDLPVLLQTLHRLTKRFPNTFDAFILSHLNDTMLAPGTDLNLYLNALENRCRTAGVLADYGKLREFWTPARRREFADSLTPAPAFGSMSNPLFYAQVLHTEERGTDLLAWLKTLIWQFMRSIPDILAIAAQTHPTECMDLVRKRATDLLETGKRDRTLYSTIAGWLAALNTVPSLKSPVTILSAQLIARFNTLRALKDELRMKGLVR